MLVSYFSYYAKEGGDNRRSPTVGEQGERGGLGAVGIPTPASAPRCLVPNAIVQQWGFTRCGLLVSGSGSAMGGLVVLVSPANGTPTVLTAKNTEGESE